MRIVPAFNISEQFRSSGVAIHKDPVGTFRLERGEKAFHHGIVVTITAPTHADRDLKIGQELLVGIAGVLASLIGMME